MTADAIGFSLLGLVGVLVLLVIFVPGVRHLDERDCQDWFARVVPTRVIDAVDRTNLRWWRRRFPVVTARIDRLFRRATHDVSLPSGWTSADEDGAHGDGR